ncbi:MAG TPA: monovalent cation:proton antiporter-2 (CPA2) family protein [Burkholderiales bacterium]|nr:monovalent cation:proton antiporter-2 (CPA2) family protein [Burkholderiales bacterium]
METHGFLHQSLIYLAAGVIAVPLFRRMGLGSVLGYLIAGVVIGPWGLRLISQPQTVLQFSEFGVVLLLFLIGLELNAQRVWALRRAIFGLGGVQVAATIAAITALALALGQPLAVGLVAGMGIAMSSTAIGLATLSEKNLLQTPGGQASFAVLLFQDLAVIPLLLIIAMLAGEATQFSWAELGKALGMIALMIAAGRLLVRPVLRYVAEARLREVFVGFSLLVVIGTAILMESAGLSMALGAFLAGVMLAESEYRHELELDIDPFKGLLLGLFFIAVGMTIDLGLFMRTPLLVLGIAAGIVLLKVAILYPIAQLFGYCNRADAGVFALALSQAGEFAFVLFAAASRMLPAETMALLNAAVALSMIATPLLFKAWERLLARRPAAERAPDAIAETNPVIVAGFGRFGQVVVRVLRGLNIGATVIDRDPGQIDTVRRFGFKAYYGDVTRMDLLESAGAARARLLIVAIDDPQAAMRAVRRVREQFPNLQLVVRARSRVEAFEYSAMGISSVRELFGSAIDAARSSLRALGYADDETARILQRFREYDEAQIAQAAPHREDEAKLIALAEQGRRDIARLLAAETTRSP